MTNWATFWLAAVKIYTLIELQCFFHLFSLDSFFHLKRNKLIIKIAAKYFSSLIWYGSREIMIYDHERVFFCKSEKCARKNGNTCVCAWCDQFNMSYQFLSAIMCMWSRAIYRRRKKQIINQREREIRM